MSHNEAIFFTVICHFGERRVIEQLKASDVHEALLRWLDLVRREGMGVLSPEVLDELEKDILEGFMEPVPCDGVVSVWNCPTVIGDELLDVVLIATVRPESA